MSVWNLSRGRSIVGSSGVDIGDGNDPDSLASQTTRLSSVDSSSSAASESSRVGSSPVGDSDSRRRRARAGHVATGVLALSRDNGATLDDLREAVTTLESVANSWKQVFGQAHPETPMVQGALEMARKTLARATAASESKAPP